VPTPPLSKVVHEFRRGFSIARHGGWGAGWGFVREELLRNSWVRMLPPGSGRARVECNLCGWRGPRFLTHCGAAYIDRNAFCPRCRSYPRHRAFAWLLGNHLARELSALERADGLRLIFAPKSGMFALVSSHVARLEGVDLHPINGLVTRLEDLQALSLADDSVDFVSCFHVLEHVPDDRRALRELQRVLRPAGRLVLCVPMTLGRARTIDLGGPNVLLNDHCFDYGEDFQERLTTAGFSGTRYDLQHVVPAELRERLGTVPERMFWLHPTPPGDSPRIVTGS